jgi:thymidylate synthase (FAD)
MTTKIEANLIAYTQPTINCRISGPESLVAYCARVSSGKDHKDRGEDYERLLQYCIKNKHWSVFEMVNAVVEVTAPRDITRQLLRHRSFSFQEFSQRYSSDIKFTERDYRHQDHKKRQNSLDTLTTEITNTCKSFEHNVREVSKFAYQQFIEMEIAKECARVVLPEGLTLSTLYVNGTLRSWIHYLEVRDDPGVTQKEHVLLARKIKEVLEPVFPTIFRIKDENNNND